MVRLGGSGGASQRVACRRRYQRDHGCQKRPVLPGGFGLISLGGYICVRICPLMMSMAITKSLSALIGGYLYPVKGVVRRSGGVGEGDGFVFGERALGFEAYPFPA